MQKLFLKYFHLYKNIEKKIANRSNSELNFLENSNPRKSIKKRANPIPEKFENKFERKALSLYINDNTVSITLEIKRVEVILYFILSSEPYIILNMIFKVFFINVPP